MNRAPSLRNIRKSFSLLKSDNLKDILHPVPVQCTSPTSSESVYSAVAHRCESCTFFESCETEARFPEQLQAAASLSLSCCCCWHQIPSLPASAALVLPNSSPASAALHLAPRPNSSKHAEYFNSWDFSASFTIFLSTLSAVLWPAC